MLLFSYEDNKHSKRKLHILQKKDVPGRPRRLQWRLFLLEGHR